MVMYRFTGVLQAFIILSIVVLSSGCPPSYTTPEATMSTLIQALKAHDVEAVVECFSVSDKSIMQQYFNDPDYRQRRIEAAVDTLSKAEVIERNDAKAIYKVQMEDETGNPIDVYFRAINENGEWKIEGL